MRSGGTRSVATVGFRMTARGTVVSAMSVMIGGSGIVGLVRSARMGLLSLAGAVEGCPPLRLLVCDSGERVGFCV